MTSKKNQKDLDNKSSKLLDISEKKYYGANSSISHIEKIIGNFDKRVSEVIDSKINGYCDYMCDPSRRFYLMNKKDQLKVANGEKSNTTSSVTLVNVEAKSATLYGLSFDIDVTISNDDDDYKKVIDKMKQQLYQTSNYSEKAKDIMKRMIAHGDYFVRGSVSLHLKEGSTGDKDEEQKLTYISSIEGHSEMIPFGSIIFDEEENYDEQELIIYRKYQNAWIWIKKRKEMGSDVIDNITRNDIIKMTEGSNYFTTKDGQKYMYENYIQKKTKYLTYNMAGYDDNGICNSITLNNHVENGYENYNKKAYGECVEVWIKEEKKIILIVNKQIIDIIHNPFYKEDGGLYRGGFWHPFVKLSYNNYWTNPINKSLPELLREPFNTSTMLLNVYKDQVVSSMNKIIFIKGTGGLGNSISTHNNQQIQDNMNGFRTVDLPPNVEIEEYYQKPNNDLFDLYNYQFDEAARISNMDRYTGLMSQGSKERVKDAAQQIQKVEEYSLGTMGDSLKHMTNNMFRAWFVSIIAKVKNNNEEVYWPILDDSDNGNDGVSFHKINPDPDLSLDFSVRYETEALNEFAKNKKINNVSTLVDKVVSLSGIDPRFRAGNIPIEFDALYKKLGELTNMDDLVLTLDESIRNRLSAEALAKKLVSQQNPIDNAVGNNTIDNEELDLEVQ